VCGATCQHLYTQLISCPPHFSLCKNITLGQGPETSKTKSVIYVKGKKVKLSLCLTNYALRHEGVWESGCIDPHFLDLGTSWRLPLGKELPVPIG
jgi:hypothetical protein